jgi:hypothetical protein
MAKRKDEAPEPQEAPRPEETPQATEAGAPAGVAWKDQPRGDQHLLGGGDPGRTDTPAAGTPAAAEQAEIAALQDEWRERDPQAGDPDEVSRAQTEEMAGRLRDYREHEAGRAERRQREEEGRRRQGQESEADARGRLFAEAYRLGYDLVPRHGPGHAGPARGAVAAPGAPDPETGRVLREHAQNAPAERPTPEGAGTYVVTWPAEPPVAVEAEGPEHAVRLAQERLGVRSSEAPPAVSRLK